MEEAKPTREFQQRFLDGFDRTRLRQEVLKTPKGLSGMKKRYAGMILGASLAVGGLIPLKGLKSTAGEAQPGRSESTPDVMQTITSDLVTAQKIAREVTGGVTDAVESIAPVQASTDAISAATEQVAEKVKEEFFAKEIPFGSIIYKEAKKNNLRPELVAAVVKTESRFIASARSGAGAQGLMQLVPKTGRWMGATNLMNPADNVKAGAKYLKYLHGQFDGDERMMIAAYNAGEGNVRKFRGVPPFKETRSYLKKVQTAEKEFAQQLAGSTDVEQVAEAR